MAAEPVIAVGWILAFLLFACVVSLILQVRSRYLSSRQRPTVSDHNDDNAAQTLHQKASIQHEIDLLQKLLDEKQRSITQIATKLSYNSGGGLNGSPSTPRRRTRREQSRSQTPTTSLSLSPRNRGLLDIIPRDSPRERWSPLGSPSMRSATKYTSQTATSPASPTASTTNDIAIEFGLSTPPQDAVAIEIAPSRPSSPAPQHRTSGGTLTQQPSLTRSHSSSLSLTMKTPIVNSTPRRSHKPSRKKSDMAEAFDSFNLYHSIKQQRSRQHHHTPQHIRTDYDRAGDDHTSWSLPISPPLLSLSSSPTTINSSQQHT